MFSSTVSASSPTSSDLLGLEWLSARSADGGAIRLPNSTGRGWCEPCANTSALHARCTQPVGRARHTDLVRTMPSLEPRSDGIVQVGRDAATGPASTRASVAIGFGSPADDSGVSRLDLNDLLIRHPQATFMMRVAGDAMREAGIDSGDLVLVDRAIDPVHGHVVIAVVEDEFVCRKLSRQSGDMRLQGTNPGCADIVADEGQALHVWGVVTQVIKSMPT